jgi:hypothetical protein
MEWKADGTYHAQDQRANLFLALNPHNARDVAKPEGHVRRGELLERPPRRPVNDLCHQAKIPVLLWGKPTEEQHQECRTEENVCFSLSKSIYRRSVF